MVRVATSLIFVMGLVTCGLAMPYKRTVDQIKQDMMDLGSHLATLNSDLQKFNGEILELLVGHP